ncbi:MAG TPA: hypothetical protein VK503_07900, partial [Candidatus Bathyarchaeia archaeon]|nr:hypothetical protein [Candidatus Bathyarchaeia archaeon]
MRGPSAPVSSFNQISISPFNPTSYMPSYMRSNKEDGISTFNITSYMPSTLRTNMTFSVPDPAPYSMSKLTEITQLLESLAKLLPEITPLLILLSIEFAILSAQSTPFKRKKKP